MGRFGRFCGSLLVCLLFSHTCWADTSFPAHYDRDIQRAVEKWWPDLPDWKLWKSQLLAESNLNPSAVSSVGAEGLAQFMDPTWQQAIRALGWPKTVSRRDASYAIEGGAWYDAQLRRQWKPRPTRTAIESHWLAAASYNRGLGWVLKDQKECNDAALWVNIAPCTDTHTKETSGYIQHIKRYLTLLQ